MNRIIIAALVLSGMTANAQVKDGMVGINTDEPRATMHIEPGVSESKGLIIPRITADQMKTMTSLAHFGADHHAIITYLKEQMPAADRTGKLVDVAEPGYYYYDNTTGVQKWKTFGGGEQDLRMVGNDNHLTKEAGVGSNGTSLGTGSRNIGIGYTFGGFSNTSDLTGGNNVGVGQSIYTNRSGGTMSGGSNTAVGMNIYTMYNRGNMTGSSNVAMGTYMYQLEKSNALFSANRNIGIGYGSYFMQSGDFIGDNNISLGNRLYRMDNGNLEGSNNIGIGRESYYVKNGDIANAATNNIALGNSIYRLSNSSTSTFSGQNNIGIGGTLYDLSSGDLAGNNNIGMGYYSYYIGTGTLTGNHNIGIGSYVFNTNGNFTGSSNISIGRNSLGVSNILAGHYNIALGEYSLYTNAGGLSGHKNIGIGYYALHTNGGGDNAGENNIAIGENALRTNSSGYTGGNNIAIGKDALYRNGSGNRGNYNVAIGYRAGFSNGFGAAYGNGNIHIGNRNMGTDTVGELDNVVAIGNETLPTSSNSTDNVILLGKTGSNAPKIGMGTYKPQAKLHVNGSIIIANDTNTCNNDTEGAIRYNRPSKQFQGCDGTNWINLH